MTAMTATTGLPFGRPLTRADLEHLPDDGHRDESCDGVHEGVTAPFAVRLAPAELLD